MASHCFFLAGGWRENAARDHLQALAQELVDRGHRVVILVDQKRDHLKSSVGNPAFYTWPSIRPTNVRDALFLVRLLHSYRPACVIAQIGAVNLMMLIGWLMGVGHRVAWHHTLTSQVIADTPLTKQKISYLLFRKRMVFSLTSHLISNSNASRADLMDVFGVSANKIFTMPNNIPDPLNGIVNLEKIEKKRNNLVCVGRMSPSKGQNVLIQAVAKLKDIKGLKVEFAGSGSQMDTLKLMAQELGVEDVCSFIGSISHNEVFERMAVASAVIVPSLNEAFGYVCIEALAVGTPVIGSRVGGIQEIIRDQVDGYLFPAGDADALANSIRSFLLDPELQVQMRMSARQHFLDSYELNRAVRAEADWFERLVT